MNQTIVVDLDSGRIVYVGDGKGIDALKKFWKRGKNGNSECISTYSESKSNTGKKYEFPMNIHR